VFAQNTKGDKPIFSQKAAKGKRVKSKPKSKASFKNFFSRRVNTHSESRASRAFINKPMPYARKNVPDRNRTGKPIGGHQTRVRSSSAQAARNNIYPRNYQWNFNPSPTPHENGRGFSNRQQVAKINSMNTRREPLSGKRVRPRSNSRPFRTRKRTNANVYWGKIKVGGEKSVSTDIAGRPLRRRDFHSANPGAELERKIIPRKTLRGDRTYRGSFINHVVVSSPGHSQRAWKGDISGHALRKIKPRPSEVSGKDISIYPHTLSNSGRARNYSKPIPTRFPQQGVSILQKFLYKIRGQRTIKGGGSNSRIFTNNGRPVNVKTPGMGANMGNFTGNIKGPGGKLFSRIGLDYSGNVRAMRPLKGGGSNSKRFNNNGHPIQVRTPGIGANMGNFRGNVRGGEKSFSQAGYGFAGNIKTGRPLKGGGSNSGRMFNNGGSPITVRVPSNGMGTFRGNMRGGEKTFSQAGYGFSGNLKAQRPLKGGGSNSGRMFNNGGNPITVRVPSNGMGTFRGNMRGGEKTFSQAGYGFSGNLKAQRPLKGGGSNSGRMFNNGGSPITVRVPSNGMGTFRGNMRGGEKTFSQAGYGFSGNLKAQRPLKGGGSNSREWNNNGKPITVRKIVSDIGFYSGHYKLHDLTPGFGYQGELYRGSMKAHGRIKGGGSNSGRLMNNDGKPITVLVSGPAEAKEVGYSGRIKLPFFRKKYVHNPNAVKEGLKKVKPSKYTKAVGELQVKVKQPEAGKNPLSVKASIKGLTPSSHSVRAAEYVGKMKMMWSYKRNPSGNEHALKSIKPTPFFMKGNDYAGRQHMKRYVHNPNSDKHALDVIAPSRVVARIRDYQGNVRMNKAQGTNLHPDSEFAHGFRDNVKQDRTFLMNIKLMWSKLFRKNATQPAVVKEKVRRPRYDKKERELWKDLYD